MKSPTILGVSCAKQTDYSSGGKFVQFTAQFTDGITTMYRYSSGKLEHIGMISTGMESFYIKTGRWPNKRSLDSRKGKVETWVEKNKKRYKALRE